MLDAGVDALHVVAGKIILSSTEDGNSDHGDQSSESESRKAMRAGIADNIFPLSEAFTLFVRILIAI